MPNSEIKELELVLKQSREILPCDRCVSEGVSGPATEQEMQMLKSGEIEQCLGVRTDYSIPGFHYIGSEAVDTVMHIIACSKNPNLIIRAYTNIADREQASPQT